MNFHLLFVSSVSACFELENTAPYYAAVEYNVLLNGAPALTGMRTNVFSLFNLHPDTEYEVSVESSGEQETLAFSTKKETACISVKDFGAVGDGEHDDTNAMTRALLCCPEGGRVTVPAGTYLTGPVVLKSHMTLELKEGATLLGKTDEESYPRLPGEITDPETGEAVQISTWEGEPHDCHQSFVSAFFARDIVITGQGRIDANAQNADWWLHPKGREVARGRLVFLNQCEDVVIHGITGANSPSWNFHPFFSKNVSLYQVTVQAPKNSPNTDGTDPESCDGVNYIGVRFSVGDDAIAIKSGKMYMGMKYQTPCRNIMIRNCLMEYAHAAIALGSEMSGGIRDLKVSQCLVVHTDRGLRIKTRRGRGKYSVVDGVEFSNIKMENCMTPLVINMYYECDAQGIEDYVDAKTPLPVDDRTPYLGDFTFRDMQCTDCEWAAGFFYGLPEQKIGSITIENVDFTFKDEASAGRPAMMHGIPEYSKLGLSFNNVAKVTLKNVTVEGQEGPAFCGNDAPEEGEA